MLNIDVDDLICDFVDDVFSEIVGYVLKKINELRNNDLHKIKCDKKNVITGDADSE